MQPRFREDFRALFWAFALFPLVPFIGYAFPHLQVPMMPLVFYLSYCAGVLMHNQNHCPVFTSKRVNRVYSIWLSIFYGLPSFTWIPTHNQNHHRYVNGPADVSHTWRHSKKHTLLSAALYPLVSGYWQARLINQSLAQARRARPSFFYQFVVEVLTIVSVHTALIKIAILWNGPALGIQTYALAFGLPAALAPSFMMFTNYVQHVDCDPTSRDNHSRNFVSGWMNWLTFNGGYHTVHHENASVHWSLYPKLHEARKAAIHPSLNEHSIPWFCFKTYVLRAARSRLEIAPT